jgi:hypothetical protein
LATTIAVSGWSIVVICIADQFIVRFVAILGLLVGVGCLAGITRSVLRALAFQKLRKGKSEASPILSPASDLYTLEEAKKVLSGSDLLEEAGRASRPQFVCIFLIPLSLFCLIAWYSNPDEQSFRHWLSRELAETIVKKENAPITALILEKADVVRPYRRIDYCFFSVVEVDDIIPNSPQYFGAFGYWWRIG